MISSRVVGGASGFEADRHVPSDAGSNSVTSGSSLSAFHLLILIRAFAMGFPFVLANCGSYR